jgi:GNAT superfamily N-acetyltransferase
MALQMIRIRNARLSDVPSIAALAGQLGYAATVEDVSNRLAQLIESSDHAVLVAVDGDGPVVAWIHAGVGLRLQSEPFVELGGLVVEKGRRRAGIGRRLVAAAAQWARERGITRLRVRSHAGRTDAQPFYEQLGFGKTKEQSVYDRSLP